MCMCVGVYMCTCRGMCICVLGRGMYMLVFDITVSQGTKFMKFHYTNQEYQMKNVTFHGALLNNFFFSFIQLFYSVQSKREKGEYLPVNVCACQLEGDIHLSVYVCVSGLSMCGRVVYICMYLYKAKINRQKKTKKKRYISKYLPSTSSKKYKEKNNITQF